MSTMIDAPITFTDDVPVDDTDSEYNCETCGRSLTYGGRGRKPRVCSGKNGGDPSCYGSSSRSTPGAAGRKSNNDKLARQATDVLVTFNAMLGTGALLIGWIGSAQAVARANESFEAQCYEALILDPNLCRMILRGGSNGGKLALALSYGMFGASVAPAVITDVRMAREAKRANASVYVAEEG